VKERYVTIMCMEAHSIGLLTCGNYEATTKGSPDGDIIEENVVLM